MASGGASATGSGGQSPASNTVGSPRGGGRGQGTSGQPAASTGNSVSTGAQGVPPAVNPVTGTPNPRVTGAGAGRVTSPRTRGR